jgi:hypothetical protein
MLGKPWTPPATIGFQIEFGHNIPCAGLWRQEPAEPAEPFRTLDHKCMGRQHQLEQCCSRWKGNNLIACSNFVKGTRDDVIAINYIDHKGDVSQPNSYHTFILISNIKTFNNAFEGPLGGNMLGDLWWERIPCATWLH